MAPRTTPLLIGALLLAGNANAGALFGLEWQSSSKEEVLDSTLVVGEFDGLLRPSMRPYAGWRMGAHQIISSLGIALFSIRHPEGRTRLGNLRVGMDYRFSVLEQESGPRLWLGLGAYQLFPLLTDENTSYTEAETTASETLLSEKKAQLAGTGLRAGLGVDIPVAQHLHLGFHHHFVDHLNFRSVDDSSLTNALIYGETGIHGQVEF
jgi:hypothetical protein